MRHHRSIARCVLVLGAVAASALAGCAAHPSTAPGTPSHEQRAVADADAILASFAVPPDARPQPSAPAGRGPMLGQPGEIIPSTGYLVDKVGWWLTPQAPAAVLGWEAAHLPHRFSPINTGGSADPPGSAADLFLLPGVPAVLASRTLTVQVIADGSQTVVRVDAMVTWIPDRPATEQVPSAVQAVTIGQYPGLNAAGGKPPEPVTITDPAKVRELEALIDGLPLYEMTTASCPNDLGNALVLSFRASPVSPALAVATVKLSGCAHTDFSIAGKPAPALASTSSTVTQIDKIAG